MAELPNPRTARNGPARDATSMRDPNRAMQQQTEAALQKGERRFWALASHAPVGIFLTDTQGDCLYVSPRWCDLAGLSPEEAIGQGWARALHPEDRESIFSAWYHAAQTGQPFAGEYRFQTPDGKVTWLDARAVALRDDQGELTGYLGTVLDISDRKRREEALARLAAIVESADDAIISVNLEGIILSWNSGAERLYQYSAAEVEGKSISLLAPPDYAHEIPQILGRLRRGERVDHFETVRLRKDGRRIPISLTVSPIKDAAGRVIGSSGIARDTAERKRTAEELEGLLKQSRRLAQRLQSVREEERRRIARELHDDLAQVLTGLKIALASLANAWPGAPSSLLEKIKSMLGLVDTTMQSVRRITTELRPGALDALGLRAALEWQALEFQDRTGIHCVFQTGLEEDPLDVDRSTAMFRIFQEALTNVARHAQASQVDIRLTRAGEGVMLEVADNGRGITECEISNMNSLGLLGMRERALAFGGAVRVQARAGGGTTVVVCIPLP